MWYIFLRDRGDTELIVSPKYNNKINDLINKLTYMKVEFAFRSDQFINSGSRLIISINEFIKEHRRYVWSEEEDEFEWLNELERELLK